MLSEHGDRTPSSVTIILGAPRSGTNMLRDLVVGLPGFGTWPCDEINYIWRHGNARHPTDELSPDQARAAVRRFIRRACEHLASRRGIAHLVEKTCANCLRVPFVDRVVPEARYLVILRDGRDATASAMKRWRAPLDLPYLLRKARYLPWTDLPYYGGRYLANRLHRWRSPDRRLATWGPRFSGMEEVLRTAGLAGACAAQWACCVKRSSEALADIAEDRVLAVRYETFVRDPVGGLQRVAAFLGVELARTSAAAMVGGVTDANVGRWEAAFQEADLARIEPILAPMLEAHGYA